MAMLGEFRLRDLVPVGLPDGRELVARGLQIARGITTQPSAFCRDRGFAGELDYKLAMAQQGRTMTALTIGLKDWPDTLAGLRHIVAATADRGFHVDRFIIALDRRMVRAPAANISPPSSSLRTLGWCLNCWKASKGFRRGSL